MQTTTVKISNGKITLPRALTDQLGLVDDRVVQAKIEGDNVILQFGESTRAPYRVYSDSEIEQFLEDDQLPPSLSKKIQARLASRK